MPVKELDVRPSVFGAISASISIFIQCSCDELWNVLTDIDSYPQNLTGMSLQRVHGPAFGVGTKWTQTRTLHGVESRTDGLVTSIEEKREEDKEGGSLVSGCISLSFNVKDDPSITAFETFVVRPFSKADFYGHADDNEDDDGTGCIFIVTFVGKPSKNWQKIGWFLFRGSHLRFLCRMCLADMKEMGAVATRSQRQREEFKKDVEIIYRTTLRPPWLFRYLAKRTVSVEKKSSYRCWKLR